MSEEAGGFAQSLYWNIGSSCDRSRRERRNRLSKRVDVVRIAVAEFTILPACLEDDVEQAGEDRAVFARERLQMDVRVQRCFGAARIDHDELHASSARRLQSFAWIAGVEAVGTD